MLKKKTAAVLCALVAVLLPLTGCGEQTTWQAASYAAPTQTDVSVGPVLAENGRFRMTLDAETLGVELTEIATGKRWGTSPARSDEVKLDEFGLPVTRHAQLESPVTIRYLDVASNTAADALAYTGAVKPGNAVCAPLDDGLRVEYYFNNCEICIPIEYHLLPDGLQMRLDPKEILEGENMLLSVGFAPFWCAAENTATDSYLFFPSGSGALIYPREISQPGESCSAAVYGDDASMEVWDQPTTAQAVRLPVYGAKTGDTATLAVLSEGAEVATINATVGSTSIGYSAVYPTFNLRGYTDNIKELYSNRYHHGTVYAESMTDTPVAVTFYPLSGDDADYNGMAARCRTLFDCDANASTSTLDLTFVGGAMVDRSFLGVPYQTLFPATTLSDVSDILSALAENGVKPSSVTLSGFGKTGVDPGELGGGFRIAGKLGKPSQLGAISELCGQTGTGLYFDFDLVRFSSRGQGVTPFFDTALRANRKQAKGYPFDIAVLGRGTDGWSLLARDQYDDAVTRLLRKAGGWAVDGVGLTTLGAVRYGDYSSRSDVAYYAAAGTASQVTAELRRIREAGKQIMTSDANAYAAACSDMVYAAPTVSAGLSLFDVDVPFYEMVFRGRVALSCQSLNLVSDARLQLLRAVESGTGLAYTLTARYDRDLLDADCPVFYNSLFSDLSPRLLEAVGQTAPYYAAVGDASIASHRIVSDTLRATTFSNGVTVWVNYGSSPVASPAGNVPAESFLIGGSAK